MIFIKKKLILNSQLLILEFEFIIIIENKRIR